MTFNWGGWGGVRTFFKKATTLSFPLLNINSFEFKNPNMSFSFSSSIIPTSDLLGGGVRLFNLYNISLLSLCAYRRCKAGVVDRVKLLVATVL